MWLACGRWRPTKWSEVREWMFRPVSMRTRRIGAVAGACYAVVGAGIAIAVMVVTRSKIDTLTAFVAVAGPLVLLFIATLVLGTLALVSRTSAPVPCESRTSARASSSEHRRSRYRRTLMVTMVILVATAVATLVDILMGRPNLVAMTASLGCTLLCVVAVVALIVRFNRGN